MTGYIQDNYEAYKWIFSILWENIFNIEDLRVFKLLKKIYDELGNENSMNEKASSQGIQRDQFHYFWSCILEDMNFGRLVFIEKIK